MGADRPGSRLSVEVSIMRRTLVAIPARLAATRLPNKPLADIHGEPMIVHVWKRCMAAGVGRVIVATDSTEIAQAVRSTGGEAVMTRADHQSGSDRIYEALNKIDPDGEVEQILNVQGDLPTIDPDMLRECLAPLEEKACHISTLCAEIVREEEKTAPHVVKMIGTPVKTGPGATPRFRALYFTRATAPSGGGPLYHHIGMYAYRRVALERFVALKPSHLEQREKLEQLRALEDGMRIDVALVKTVPLGVDTPEDLERARTMLAPRS
jgi:3-deoxy-manno-octulosonate cytidylyltransferase (CMP-KDO synthetase)